MSPPGRPKGEYRRAQPKGTPVRQAPTTHAPRPAHGGEPHGARSAAASGAATPSTATALVKVHRLQKTFDLSPPLIDRLLQGQPRRLVKAVDEVSFTIPRGRTLALVGESGCGKSTVAKMLMRLVQADDGFIEFDGEPVQGPGVARPARSTRQRMQMIFQDPYASLNPRWSVLDIVSEPLVEHGQVTSRDERRATVAALLHTVGLSEADASKYPHQFSGGQRQRISIARALASRPDFLVCDEPTSALDVSVQAQVLNIMKDLQQDLGLTYLFISHNLAVVQHVADQVGVMYLGRLVELADKATLFEQPRHPYTRMLLDAIPDLEMSGRARQRVHGEVPNPHSPPSGCTFHPRCPLATARCKAERPAWRCVDGGWVACHLVESAQAGLP